MRDSFHGLRRISENIIMDSRKKLARENSTEFWRWNNFANDFRRVISTLKNVGGEQRPRWTYLCTYTHTRMRAHTHTHTQCTRALLSVSIRMYMQTYVHRDARSPYVGTRIEMEWDFSSIYSSCERIPMHIRCYLPFVPRRVKPLNGRLKRAIVWRASGINMKKRRIDELVRTYVTACS